MKVAKLWEKWKHVRKEVAGGVTVHVQQAVPATPGLFMAIATTPMSVVPVGIVWYSFVDQSTINVQYSWTIRWARRLGVRTAIHRAMVAGHPGHQRIVTSEATGKKSRKWLGKMGFTDQGDRFVWRRGK